MTQLRPVSPSCPSRLSASVGGNADSGAGRLCQCGLKLHATSLRYGHKICGRCRQQAKYRKQVAEQKLIGSIVGQALAGLL